VYSDNDLSASRNSHKARPAYERMLADVRAGRVQALLAYSTSRLTRRPREFEDLIDLAEHGLRIHTTASGDVDLDASAGRFYARMLAARDASEAEEASERAKRERQQRREQGRWNGGKRPFGWDRDGTTPRPTEQAMIREACERILIARQWTAAGYPPPQGGAHWIPNTIREIVRNPRIAGMLPDGRPAVWPAIVDEATWRGVVAVLADSARYSGRGPSRMLTALAYCGACLDASEATGTDTGRPSVHGGTDRHGNPLYCCANRNHLGRRVEPVDRWVTDVVLAWLARERITPPPRADTGPLAALAAGLRARLGEAADLYAAGRIDAAQLDRITATVRAELDAVETQLTLATSGRTLAALPRDLDSLRAGWAVWDIDRRRAILKATGLHITVYPPGRGAKRFDPATVRIR
jgi:site-specific DNA recombinase